MAVPSDITLLISQDRLGEALAALDTLIASSPDDDALIFARGRVLWRLGRRADAIADYGRAAELNPGGPASRALEHSRDIMDFFNPDLLNP
ncbi:MAG: tetratricopeptide repeat protein [Pseudoflavonifractor sp.]|nr:tetratricopeptide repeat protein [Pseudoflavonifractor sp.]